MERFEEIAGKFLWMPIEQCRSLVSCTGRSRTNGKHPTVPLATVSISVQPFLLFLNSIFRSYIHPF